MTAKLVGIAACAVTLLSAREGSAATVGTLRTTPQVPDASCTPPIASSMISDAHDRVHAWVELKDVRPGDRYEYRWYDVYGLLRHSASYTRDKAEAKACSFSWMTVTAGDWTVKFYYNGELKSSAKFAVPRSRISFVRGRDAIVITAPHGGDETIPGVPKRTGDDTNVSGDLHTYELANEVAEALRTEHGLHPYVIREKVQRQFLDVNRPRTEAFESTRAALDYDDYHLAVATSVAEARAKLGRGLLIDVHGQSDYPNGVLRGTRDGLTVKALLSRGGWATMHGPHGLYGHLAARHYQVLPTTACTTATSCTSKTEIKAYNGQYTVENYGSHQAGGIDAIQVESGNLLREGQGGRLTLAQTLAAGIADMYKTHFAPR